MCGVAGIYEYARRQGAVDSRVLEAMRDTLYHRGPDAEGVYLSPDRRIGLAHRRLSIVDLEHGNQPMRGAHGRMLVFNGEIYNYPALRRELERDGVVFATHCDTEVILHLYARHGRDCVRHLNGMFAFALWDPRSAELFFARDRLGEKPFYWTECDGRMIFASEIKALLQHPCVSPDVNEDAISEYLLNLVASSPQTLFKGIWKLPAGYAGVCSEAGVRTHRYWSLFAPREFAAPPSPADAAVEVRRLLDISVNDRLMSDVPVGVLLSGGLDSTTIVALLRGRARGLATFSVGFAGKPAIDERAEAARVAKHFGTNHHEVAITEADALDFLTQLIHHQDEPLGDPVCIPLNFVCQLAREEGIKVVMAGEGADELFWGYPAYRRLWAQANTMRRLLGLPSPVRRGLAMMMPVGLQPRYREVLDGIASGRPLPMHMPLGFTRAQRDRLLKRGFARNLGWAPSSPAQASDPLETLGWDTQEYEFGLRLPELLLMRIDRFSMANSVEARVPFLDPALVEYAYRLPFDWKLRNGQTKLVLKQAIGDIVPDWVLARPKQGFGAPVVDWFASQLTGVLRNLMRTESIRAYFDVATLEALIRGPRLRGGNPNTFSLWFVLNFALWHRYWVAGESLESIVEPLAAAQRKAPLQQA